jgi:hypothetical protein
MSRLTPRIGKLEGVHSGRHGVHVFRVPRDLDGEALEQWKAEATAGIPKASTVVMVQLRDAEVTG